MADDLIQKTLELKAAWHTASIGAQNEALDCVIDELITIMKQAVIIEGHRQAALLVVKQLEDDLRTALHGLQTQSDWIGEMRSALEAIDKAAMQVMQDDVPPYGSILRCGWVHEVCSKALRNEVR